MTPAEILARARAELGSTRAVPATWAGLDVDLAPDRSDRNGRRRALVLYGLQYDRRAGDLPLLRRLEASEEEVTWTERAEIVDGRAVETASRSR